MLAKGSRYVNTLPLFGGSITGAGTLAKMVKVDYYYKRSNSVTGGLLAQLARAHP